MLPSSRKSRLLAASSCVLALLSFAAEASEDDASAPANDASTPRTAQPGKGSVGVEEITVTGRRREERLQSTPLSMVAIPDHELQARQFTDITDVGQAAANVKFDGANGSNSSTRVYIRGVGQDDTRSNVDPGVGIYVDGVYYPRAQGSVISVFDVERIEVLRGPQGTLFGKNTVGGVVHVVTKKPAPDFEAGANLRYGNIGLLETSLSLNVPLVAERAFARLSFNTQTDDGYLRNSFDGERSGDNKLLGVRASLRTLLQDDITLDLSYERSQENEKVPVSECRLGSPFSQGRFLQDNVTDFRSACPLSRDGDGGVLTGSQSDLAKQFQDIQGATGTLNWGIGDATLTSITSWRVVGQRSRGTDVDGSGADAIGVDRGKFQNDTWSQEFQLTDRVLADRLVYQVGAYGFKEKGHSKSQLSSFTGPLADAGFPLNAARASNADAKLQELNNLRAILDGLIGPIGAPVMNTRGQTVGPLGPASALDFRSVDETLSRGAALFPFFLGGQMRTPEAVERALITSSPTRLRDNLFVANSILLDRFETLSYAAFGELSYDFTRRLSLTAGARFTHERRFRQGKQLQLADPANFNPDISGLPIDDRFDKWTSRLQLSYQATEGIFLYGSYNRGFKSGGFNADVISPDAFGTATRDRGKFDEEVVDAYELGVKTQWLDRRLVLNLSGFYYKYDNIQISTLQTNDQGTPETRISNVAEAVIRGLELEIQAVPAPNLTLAAGLGLIDDDYRDFTARVDAQKVLFDRPNLRPPEGCTGLALEDACPLISQLSAVGFLINPGELPFADMSDLDRSNTPNFSMNLSADYRLDLGGLGALDLRATWYHQGRVFYTTSNDDEVAQGKYGLLNGRISWELADGKTTLALFARNLLDRRFIEGGFSLNDGIGAKSVYYGRPRTYGIEVSRQF